jgi:hypothetical protein
MAVLETCALWNDMEAVFLELERPGLGPFLFFHLVLRLSLLEAITSPRFTSSLVWFLIKWMTVFTRSFTWYTEELTINKFPRPVNLLLLFILLAAEHEWVHVRRFGVCPKFVENSVVRIGTLENTNHWKTLFIVEIERAEDSSQCYYGHLDKTCRRRLTPWKYVTVTIGISCFELTVLFIKYCLCRLVSARRSWVNKSRVRWRIIFFWSLQYATCFMPPFWHLEFWGSSRIFGKCMHLWNRPS